MLTCAIALAISSAALAATDNSLAHYLSALPTAAQPKVVGVRHYRFTTDYFQYDGSGNFTSKERVAGDYTRGLPGDQARWDNVTIANATGLEDTFPTGAPQKYMDGFTYKSERSGGLADAFQPGFFAGFPDVMETKTLVWDSGMFEVFAWNFLDKLQLNQPYPFQVPDTPMPGGGSFHNRRPELTWVGITRRNGKICAVIQYEALFNTLNFNNQGNHISGTSSYWGTIWMGVDDKQIEYATLREDVLASVQIPGPNGPRTMVFNTIRVATLEPLTGS
jgi:hypothetical protein